MRLQPTYRALLAGAISLYLVAAQASTHRHMSSEEIIEMVNRGEVLSVLDLQQLHPFLEEGRWLDIELEFNYGRWVYEFETIDKENSVKEYYFDAKTGEFILIKIKDYIDANSPHRR